MLRLIVRFTYLFMRLSAIKPLDGLPIVLTGERLQRKKKTYHSKGNLLSNPPTFNVGKDANRIALFKQPLLCQHSISRRHPAQTMSASLSQSSGRAPIIEGKGEAAKCQRPVQDVACPHGDLARWIDDRAGTYDGVLTGGAKKENGANFMHSPCIRRCLKQLYATIARPEQT